MAHLRINQADVNCLAQTFYEHSNIRLESMTDKPKIIAGLTAVFTELGVEVTPDGH